MTPNQIKEARRSLGLSVNQLGALLDTDGQSIRRMEMEPDKSTARTPAPRMVRLIEAYLAGYRPADYPKSSSRYEDADKSKWWRQERE